MRYFLAIFAAMFLCALPAHAQTMKALMYNTNGQVVYGGTNSLSFTDSVSFTSDVFGFSFEAASGSNYTQLTPDGVEFSGAAQRATTRTNLGLGATWLTNTNATNFRTAIGLGENDTPTFSSLSLDSGQIDLDPAETLGQQLTGFTVTTNSVVFSIAAATFLEATTNSWVIHRAPTYSSTNIREQTRDNLLLGSTNIVTFAGLTNNGDIRINQTTPTNGLLYAYRTNNEPFLGLANLIASNNTTLSNETLFRVGRAEATNQAAQFGFRVVRTNNGGEGFATFSVFGYNALMMIGPSDRSRTNTATNAGIEADIYTISGSNRVMTLRDTNTGALTLHQDIGFGAGLTNNAPTNTNTPAVWLRVWVGTNNYRLPLYQ